MHVPLAHRDTCMAKGRLDGEYIRAGHSEPGAKRMPAGMRNAIPYLRCSGGEVARSARAKRVQHKAAWITPCATADYQRVGAFLFERLITASIASL
jgi:hypothetical protein